MKNYSLHHTWQSQILKNFENEVFYNNLNSLLFLTEVKSWSQRFAMHKLPSSAGLTTPLLASVHLQSAIVTVTHKLHSCMLAAKLEWVCSLPMLLCSCRCCLLHCTAAKATTTAIAITIVISWLLLSFIVFCLCVCCCICCFWKDICSYHCCHLACTVATLAVTIFAALSPLYCWCHCYCCLLLSFPFSTIPSHSWLLLPFKLQPLCSCQCHSD